MADAIYTDAYGYPLSSISVLRRRRQRQPLYRGAVTVAAPGISPPVTIDQVVAQDEEEKRRTTKQ